jgi:hypothetical protein
MIEIHRDKDWSFDLKHGFPFPGKGSERAPCHSFHVTPIGGHGTYSRIIGMPQKVQRCITESRPCIELPETFGFRHLSITLRNNFGTIPQCVSFSFL